VATNVLPRTAATYAPFPSQSTTSSALSNRPRGGASFIESDGDVHTFAADHQDLFKLGTASFANVSRQSGSYTVGTNDHVNFINFGNRVISVNGHTDPPQSFRMGTDSTFTDLLGVAATCTITISNYANLANGDNLVIPTVGDEVESIRKKATELKDAGYEVDLVDVVVPAKEAKKRMIARFAKTGRIIPFEYLRTVGDNPTKNYDLLREEGVFDGYARIDNSVGFRDAKPLVEDTRELFEGTEIRLQDRRAGGGGRSQESPIPSDSAADLREAEKQRGIGSL